MSILFTNCFHSTQKNENQSLSSSQYFANLSGSKLSVSASMHCINTVNTDGKVDIKGIIKSRSNLEYQTRENESKDQTTSVAVKTPVGRLKNAYEHWKISGASDQVLGIISNGYNIPFKEVPDPIILPNNKSARENPSFVSNEIENRKSSPEGVC